MEVNVAEKFAAVKSIGPSEGPIKTQYQSHVIHTDQSEHPSEGVSVVRDVAQRQVAKSTFDITTQTDERILSDTEESHLKLFDYLQKKDAIHSSELSVVKIEISELKESSDNLHKVLEDGNLKDVRDKLDCIVETQNQIRKLIANINVNFGSSSDAESTSSLASRETSDLPRKRRRSSSASSFDQAQIRKFANIARRACGPIDLRRKSITVHDAINFFQHGIKTPRPGTSPMPYRLGESPQLTPYTPRFGGSPQPGPRPHTPRLGGSPRHTPQLDPPESPSPASQSDTED